MTKQLLSTVKQQIVSHFGEVWFLHPWPWPNPDAGHLRVRIPLANEHAGWTGKHIDLRIRPAVELLTDAAVPGHLRPGVIGIGCWFFDGAEQVAMTDFWILVLEEAIPHRPPTCVVLPTSVLLNYLRRSADTGWLYLYFTHAGVCYTSPCLETNLSTLRVAHGPGSFSFRYSLTSYLNAWYQLAGCCP